MRRNNYSTASGAGRRSGLAKVAVNGDRWFIRAAESRRVSVGWRQTPYDEEAGQRRGKRAAKQRPAADRRSCGDDENAASISNNATTPHPAAVAMTTHLSASRRKKNPAAAEFLPRNHRQSKQNDYMMNFVSPSHSIACNAKAGKKQPHLNH